MRQRVYTLSKFPSAPFPSACAHRVHDWISWVPHHGAFVVRRIHCEEGPTDVIPLRWVGACQASDMSARSLVRARRPEWTEAESMVCAALGDAGHYHLRWVIGGAPRHTLVRLGII